MECELCRKERELTKHHLIPKMTHSKNKFRRKYGKREMRARHIYICKICHKGLHDLFSEKELAESFATKEDLMADERVRKHVAWSRKQKL